MEVMQFPRMVISSREGWDLVARLRPSMDVMFLRVVLPLSLLPPLMILVASGGMAAEMFPGVTFGNGLIAAVIFFVAEHFSVPIMANSIRLASMAKEGSNNLHDAYAVAAIAPIPLWLSSLAVLFGSVWFMGIIGLLSLGASAMLVRHGVDRLLGVHEPVYASEVAVQVMSFGALVWLALLGVAAGALILL
ncbi:YIP1 family protein [Thauera sp. WH-2]|jgi:hypothetical protein|uniref:YIP1 family protein n=1 Tax=unclassified Thauera TaxID=2609274 RepID=UPI002A387607|nr:hypothetical protein [Thauera sp.]